MELSTNLPRRLALTAREHTRFPELSHLALRVWQRNARVWIQFYKPSLLGNLGEPVLFLLAMGYGLGRLVPLMDGVPYVQYLAPGLVVSSAMYTATFECCFGSFTRMIHQKTYAAIIATPVSIEEVVAGDILWGATKSLIGGMIIMMVIAAFRLVQWPWAFAIVPVILVVEGLMFSSMAMFITSMSPSYDFFTYYFTLFITPMFLFSGIFFPLSGLPVWAQKLSWFFPLTHVVNLVRAAVLGRSPEYWIMDLIWIAACTILFFTLSANRIRRRLLV
ncbi:MAG: ABC transporter permease [Deltaproteobacteria bacterium]|nr:ABC transporter permease [Deltaproteobacteria bacterium]